MPNNATQLYRKHPTLQTVLDFLDRCTVDGQQVVAHYRDAHALEAAIAACAGWSVHPARHTPARGLEGTDPQGEHGHLALVLDREDWRVLSGHAMTLMAKELRMRLPAIDAALKLVPVPWDALALADNALAAWGKHAGMIALPGRMVFDYFGSRYPSDAPQRGKYGIVQDVEHAAAYKDENPLGFLLDKSGFQNFACHGDDWRKETASARTLLNDHLSLMLKLGLQMLEAGASAHLTEMQAVLAVGGEAPSLVRMQTLLEIYGEHVAAYGPGQNWFRCRLVDNCLGEFQKWHGHVNLIAAQVPAVAKGGSTIGTTTTATTTTTTTTRTTSPGREWTWVDSGVAAIAAPDPGTPPASPTEVLAADGVVIPDGVTVAPGAHVRVCAISSGSRLKAGTVLHGDVSIASHTRFAGPLTIMHDVRIGWGLTFGPGLILSEGATISSFAVHSKLPQGTRIGGSLRIGENVAIGNNVSFGAENWIGADVRIGENVRFGPYVKVDNGIVIGANAWIKGHARLIGDVPGNAEVAVKVAGMKSIAARQAGHPYAIDISPFNIAKNETIRERPATVRMPLASALDAEDMLQDDTRNMTVQEAGTPDRPAGKTATEQLQTPEARSPAATRTPGFAPRTFSAVGKPRGATGEPPVPLATPAGTQLKRKAEPLTERAAKRVCIGLEPRYNDAETGHSPGITRQPDDPMPSEPPELTQLRNKSAFLPVQATSTSTTTSTSTSMSNSTAWLDQQKPVQRPAATASLAATNQHAPESPLDRAAQRKVWESLVISKENQSALERAMRQSIRVPTVKACAKPDERMPEPMTRHRSPMTVMKGPKL
jgi:acetyltransferase-like isoleucine patch superfamily enzyme